MEKRIQWAGNLVEEKRLSGYINSIRVASIAPVNGLLTLAMARGLEPHVEPVKSVNEGKTRAEERLDDFLFALNAQFIPPEEMIFIEALRGMAHRNEQDDARIWAQLVDHWERKHEERQNMVDYLRERLAQRKAQIEHEEAARAEE